MDKKTADDLKVQQINEEQAVETQEAGSGKGEKGLSEQEIVQMYKKEAANKRKRDKNLMTKLKKKVKELKKDDSNVYPLY